MCPGFSPQVFASSDNIPMPPAHAADAPADALLATVSFADGQVLLSVYDPVTDTVHPSLVKPGTPALEALLACPADQASNGRQMFEALHRHEHGCDAQCRMASICQPSITPATSTSLLEAAERMMACAEPVDVEVPACGKRWRSMASRPLQVLVGILVPA